MDKYKLLRGDPLIINNKIKFKQPKLGEICDYGFNKYLSMVSLFCSTPYDLKVPLLDVFNIDYEKITWFELFRMNRFQINNYDTSILIEGIDFNNLQEVEKDNKMPKSILLYDDKNDAALSEEDFLQIANFLRKTHNYPKEEYRFMNEQTKKYVIDMERRRLKRKQDKEDDSFYDYISGIIVSTQSLESYKAIWDLTMYQFTNYINRYEKIRNANALLGGMYSGMIDGSKINKKDLSIYETL